LKDISLALAYGLYAGFAVLSFFFVARFIDETKGRQLEDMHATVHEGGKAPTRAA
jgi:MFS transporter, SP family, sugar:H+ symporter